MSFSNYWSRGNSNNRVQDAMSFIRSGSTEGNNLYIPDVRQGCQDSSRCASGWSCVGGYCQQNTPSGVPGDGSTSGCGGDPGNGGGGGGGCSPSTASGASSGKCTKTGCGGNGGGGGSDCCGARCCRFSAGSAGTGTVVSCRCGPCPPPGNCNQFCDEYLKANGESAEGCSGECSECEECKQTTAPGTEVAFTCQPRGGGAPCHCPQSSCSGECEKCEEDGICRDDCRNCQRCATVDVDCGCTMVTAKCCQPACDPEGNLDNCREKVNCNLVCPPPGGSECEGGCKTITVCDGSPPPCPPKSTCTTTGTISAGGKTCNLIRICDKSGVPEGCGECDCNCKDECGLCETCDQLTGKCAADPSCNAATASVRSVIQVYLPSFPLITPTSDPNDCGPGTTIPQAGGVFEMGTSAAGPGPHTLRIVSPGKCKYYFLCSDSGAKCCKKVADADNSGSIYEILDSQGNQLALQRPNGNSEGYWRPASRCWGGGAHSSQGAGFLTTPYIAEYIS